MTAAAKRRFIGVTPDMSDVEVILEQAYAVLLALETCCDAPGELTLNPCALNAAIRAAGTLVTLAVFAQRDGERARGAAA